MNKETDARIIRIEGALAQAFNLRSPHDSNVGGSERQLTREELVEQWKNAPQGIKRYPAGTTVDVEGKTYEYDEGARLWIGNELEVMDSCQDPWARETVRQAFSFLDENWRNELERGEVKRGVKVLERGFGIGLIAGYIMEELRKRGGTYSINELNEEVTDFINTKWIPKQETISRASATSQIGGRYRGSNVSIEVIGGDAVAETKRLAEEERKFDIIISDTFPLTPEERSVNDLLDLETLVKCLDPKGVFAFFGYYAGSKGGLGSMQRNIVTRYFREIHETPVRVNPPPDYQYFKTPNGMIREIPVVICLKPRLYLTEGKP